MQKSWKIATAAGILAVMISLSNGADAKVFSAATIGLPQSTEQSVTLKEQARLWAEELSNAQDSIFLNWKGAWISTAPLGPGTHSWIVLFKQNQTIVGYMIVHSKENGEYMLGEYGTGEYPPFSTQSLKIALSKLGLNQTSMKARRVYVHPLQAAWQLTSGQVDEVHYTDAYSGEELPVDSAGWDELAGQAEKATKHGLTNTHASIRSSASMTSFDPYGRMPWLTKRPYSITSGSFDFIRDAVRQKQEIRYVSETFQGRMLYVWSIAGYTEWSSGEQFIAIDTDEDSANRRYVPATLLRSLGQFYL
ncbi:hypothetical protein RB620_06145 [Paenibacillus sp. LHD-117]|uniref:hypothetical protein n=1 Tax=Paenibacillus sp. LHD-117 TaxID=3071412 RepID=UPI0027E207F0|nr:hypothetical protein [Paenibacillus sp. LHD-117]MDQ6419018.1 hypothetical protein [Paenibacillus sp. LHD-117]